jgi:hypothetical protein
MKRILIFLALAILLLLASGVLALFSDNYRLDWYTPLTGGGGGPASSTNYAVNLTVGQTAIGVASGSSYQACLGFWCGGPSYRVYLPLVLRQAS